MRLVAYEGLSRALTPIFNEKAMCALGKGVFTSGRLAVEGVDKALKALRRFRALCNTMEVDDVTVIATAAARDAANGPAFLNAAHEAIGYEITLLSGGREAELSALGVISAIRAPDGVVGDLGGGSLELIDVVGDTYSKGVTLPLGGLALMDASKRSTRDASRIARKAIADASPLAQLRGRAFYAVGGTWRALAKLHMRQRDYPLDVMHNYRIQTSDAAEFAELVERMDSEAITDIGVVSAARRPLLAYGAIVLDEIIRRAKPKEIVISAAGVREGLLYERLSAANRAFDPLLCAARAQSALMARAPAYGDELIAWSDTFMASCGQDETFEERRLRHAACLLSDVAWRAHPDYRAQQATNIVTYGAFIGVDHPSSRISRAGGGVPPPGTGRRTGIHGATRTFDDATTDPRAPTRLGDASRLSALGLDAGRPRTDAVTRSSRALGADAAGREVGSCKRALAQSRQSLGAAART